MVVASVLDEDVTNLAVVLEAAVESDVDVTSLAGGLAAGGHVEEGSVAKGEGGGSDAVGSELARRNVAELRWDQKMKNRKKVGKIKSIKK